jgi:glutamyl-tRNA reductase
MVGDAPATADERVADARETVAARAAEIRDRELAEALRRLEARGDLPDGQAAAVETMADRLVAALLAPADDGLRAAAESGDDATVDVVCDLFGGPDG